MFYIHIFLILIVHYSYGDVSQRVFPEGFKFGVGTSSYQIEGAWNEDGKSENIWDHVIHKNPALIENKSNADVACDSYHKFKEDVKLMKDLGLNFYRFSISWTRVLPDAVKGSKLNEKGVAYYNNLIDELLANGIEPYVTIFHWDTPQSLETDGSWLNETIIDNYVYYARQLFVLYGDRVKKWITFNEPKQICLFDLLETGEKAPYLKLPEVGNYLCYHNIVRAHGKIYRIYDKEFRPIQKGEIGMTVDCLYGEPKTNSESDQMAAEQYMQFLYGWFVHPITIGNYPPIMIERIDELSKQEGRVTSRLPKFTEEEIEMIKGTSDFLGLNHYSSLLTTFGDSDSSIFAYERDSGVVTSCDPSWKPSASSWLYEVPTGFYHMLLWIKEHYNNPPVLITENGWAGSDEELNDLDRVQYLTNYLSALLKALDDGCNVIGYTHWSIMDNFEWTAGYTIKFGLTYIDFNDPNRTRIPRTSYKVYQNIIKTRRLIGD